MESENVREPALPRRVCPRVTPLRHSSHARRNEILDPLVVDTQAMRKLHPPKDAGPTQPSAFITFSCDCSLAFGSAGAESRRAARSSRGGSSRRSLLHFASLGRSRRGSSSIERYYANTVPFLRSSRAPRRIAEAVFRARHAMSAQHPTMPDPPNDASPTQPCRSHPTMPVPPDHASPTQPCRSHPTMPVPPKREQVWSVERSANP